MKATVKASGYLHKGETGEIVRENDRFVYLRFKGSNNVWPYQHKEVRRVK
jgi:hypothetical protein